MNRRTLVPILDLVLVTGLLVPFGLTIWSLLAGPVSAFAIWALDRSGREPAPVRTQTSAGFQPARVTASAK